MTNKLEAAKGYCAKRDNWPALVLLLVSIVWTVYKHSNLLLTVLDSGAWMNAGAFFAKAVAAHQWQQTLDTNVGAHPGVTVLWISALLYWLKPLLYDVHHALAFTDRWYVLELVVINGIKLGLLAPFVYYLKRYLDDRLVLVAVAYWLSQRLLFGLYSTWPDQLLACLMVCALVVWIKFTEKPATKWLLVIVGILFGLAILTKVIGWVLLPMLVICSWPWLKQSPVRLAWVGVVGVVGIVVYYAFYPLAWVDPLGVLISRVHATGMGDVSIGQSGGVGQLVMWETITLTTIDLLFIPSMVYLAYLFYKSRHQLTRLWQTPTLALAMTGAFYSLIIVAIGIVLTDHWVGDRAFFSPRYYTPAIMLVSLPLLQLVWTKLTKRQFYLLFGLLLALEMLISQLYLLPWAFNLLEN